MNTEPPGVSIVITVYNNASSISELLDSLLLQEGPKEIVVVDSMSTDGTSDILARYAGENKEIRYFSIRCSRGGGRNIGVSKARYDFVAFTDGDAIADPEWIKSMRKFISLGYEMIIGRVLQVGNERFRTLNRVELIYNGYEVTAPSANLGYSKDLFVKLGGFDESFITAEDIDLNIRCVKSGARIAVCDQCIVMNRTRDTLHGVIKQAFWNGYGRKQLAWKHPESWSHLNTEKVVGTGMTPLYLIRSISAATGYLSCILFGKRPTHNWKKF